MTSFSFRALAVLLAATLAGCAAVSKVDKGEALIRSRLTVQVTEPWNQFERGLADNTPTWTHEGITVDTLQFYVGVKDGELLAPTPTGRKGIEPLTFRAAMQPADVMTLLQSLLTRDGSSFSLDRLEATEFVGARGFRIEYSMVRKLDEVRLRGVAFGAVRSGELFLINYSAPRLAFYPKHAAGVEALARSAKVKG
jgi:hypothetical protein